MRARAGQVSCQWSLNSVECMLRMTRTPLAVPSTGSMVQWFETWTLEPACLGQPYRAWPAPFGRKKKARTLSPGLGYTPSASAILYARHSMAFMPRKHLGLLPGRSPLQGTERTQVEGCQLPAAIGREQVAGWGSASQQSKIPILDKQVLSRHMGVT